jgi:hypothetical protein
LRSASKLKRSVIEGTGGLFWFSVIVDFSSPIFFVGSYVPWIVMRTLSVNLFYIFHDIRLSSTFLWTFFSMWSSVFVLRFCFFLNLMLNMTWITGHIHRSIVDKIDSTSEDIHWVKYICEQNRIYLPCLQLISKKYFLWTVTKKSLLVQKWKNGLWWHLWWKSKY